jgi:translocation and assembly module TamB
MKKVLKVLAVIVLTILILLGVLVWGLQTPTGQAFITDQVNSYLRKKINNRGRIEKLRFDIPDWIVLEGVYLEDTKGDTLLSARHLRVDLDMYSLIKGQVGINKVVLENATANLSRSLPDTVFNFQYLVDAFAGTEPTQPDSTPSKPIEMRLDQILLKKVRLSYEDAVIGTDVRTSIDSAEVQFDKFNPTRSQYHPVKIVLSGTSSSLRMYAPLKQPEPSVKGEPADSLDLRLGDLDIRDLKWQFTDETSGLTNHITLKQLEGHIDQIFLGSQQVKAGQVKLEAMTASVVFAKTPKSEEKSSDSPRETEQNVPGWNVKIGNIQILNNNLRFDDFNQPQIPKGLDYSHLNVNNLNVDLQNFIFSDENIAGALKSASFKEKSGFNIQQLRTDFSYGAKQTYLRNLYLKTSNTLLRDELVLQYKNQQQLSDDIANVGIKLKLSKSQVSFDDILLLAPDLAKTPPFDKQPHGILKVSGLITGRVADMTLAGVELSTLEGTTLKLSGRITGLPVAEKLAVDLNIPEMASTKGDLLKILPDSTLPASVELPENIKVSAKVNGGMKSLATTARIETSYGTGTFSGTLKNIADSVKATYNGTLNLDAFDVGSLLKQPADQLGKISLRTDVDGTGYAPKTMRASLTGTIQSADIKGYVYNNLDLTGNIDHGLADIDARINDANIKIDLNGSADLRQEYPAVRGSVRIDQLNLTALKLYPDSLELKGTILIDMQSTKPENPLGTVNISELVLTHHGKPVPVSEISMLLSDSLDRRHAKLTAPFLKANIEGDFEYTELADAILVEIDKHFKVSSLTHKEITKPVNISIDATAFSHPALRVFIPKLTSFKPIQLHAKLDNQKDSTIVAAISVPMLDFDSIRTENANVQFYTVPSKAALNASLGSMKTGGFRIQNASLTSNIAANDIRFDFLVKDSVNVDRHAVKGDLAVNGSKFKLSLRDDLLLNYQEWETATNGFVQYSPDSLLVKDLIIKDRSQSIAINNTTDQPNSPLAVKFDNIQIGPMIAIVTQDSTMATGTLNGEVLLKNYLATPVFTGDLKIDDLAVTKIAVGDLTLSASNESENKIQVAATLKSGKNDLEVKGTYDLKAENAMDFKMDLRKLGASTVEAFSFGELKNATGNLRGNAAITGSTSSPRLNGNLTFDSVAFNVTKLGTRYTLSDQQIGLVGQRINFNNFVIADSLNQQMKIDGNVNISSLPDVGYNLTIGAKNFAVLNSTQKQNEQFFGKAAIDATLTVKGQGSKAIIDGKVKIDPGSNVTVVLTDDATEAGDATKGVIEFVDVSDSTAVEKSNAIEPVQVNVDFASQISLDIDVDDKSEFKVVIDELNGDNIRLRGNAHLNTGISPNGQLYLIGAYDLTKGSYDLTLQILKRQFEIKKGSTLIWTGDPMKAELNITAAYEVQVDPGSIDNNYKGERKIPMEVQIVITGNLSNPNINFNIAPGEDAPQSIVKDIRDQTFWNDMQNNPSEMNKQAFALLITNKFITDQTTSGFNFGASAEAIARQSVSQLLSDQLNNLASDLFKGVNLDLNLNSTMDQSSAARTDLNVGLSKAFLGDRLKVSVGKNFELESKGQTPSSSQVFDNIELSYALSKDGRYRFRGYRKNQYQSILEGFIVETGVSFIITADYNLFREIFQRQKNEN